MSINQVFPNGAMIHLKSAGPSQHLCCDMNGQWSARGGNGTFATWRVHNQGQGFIRLERQEGQGCFVAINNNMLCTGQGGPFCHLIPQQQPNGTWCFAAQTGQGRVGVLDDGSPKPANQTGVGVHGQWHVKYQGGAMPRMGGMPGMGMPMGMPQQGMGMPQQGMGGAMQFQNGSTVWLTSAASNKNLRLRADGVVTGDGGQGAEATWRVHNLNNGFIRLELAQAPGRFLAIKDNVSKLGMGGEFCQLIVEPQPNGTICLLSFWGKARGVICRVGIMENGQNKTATETGVGLHGQFRVAAAGGMGMPQQGMPGMGMPGMGMPQQGMGMPGMGMPGMGMGMPQQGMQGPNLQAGGMLQAGQALRSPNGMFHATLQADNNFVVYRGNQPLFASRTNGRGRAPCRMAMQPDGNFVLYDAMNQALWATQTHGRGGQYVSMQDDGNFVMYDHARNAKWCTRTDNGQMSPHQPNGQLL